MKKIILSVGLLVAIASVHAQSPAPAPMAPQMSKEEKAKMQQQKEADFKALLDGAGLDDTQKASINAAMSDFNTQAKEVKRDATLGDEVKKTKLKEVSDAYNAKLKAIMGEEKYKKFSDLKKQQKAQAATMVPAKN